MSKLSVLLKMVADTNKAIDYMDRILNLEYPPCDLEDVVGLKNEWEQLKLKYVKEIEELDKNV